MKPWQMSYFAGALFVVAALIGAISAFMAARGTITVGTSSPHSSMMGPSVAFFCVGSLWLSLGTKWKKVDGSKAASPEDVAAE